MTEQEEHRLSKDIILMDSALNDALYSANRYERVGFDHLEQSAIDHLEDVRSMLDETLARYDDADAEEVLFPDGA